MTGKAAVVPVVGPRALLRVCHIPRPRLAPSAAGLGREANLKNRHAATHALVAALQCTRCSRGNVTTLNATLDACCPNHKRSDNLNFACIAACTAPVSMRVCTYAYKHSHSSYRTVPACGNARRGCGLATAAIRKGDMSSCAKKVSLQPILIR